MNDGKTTTPVPPPGLMPEGDILHLFIPSGAHNGASHIEHFTSRDGMSMRAEPPALCYNDANLDDGGFGGVEIAAGSRIYRMIYAAARRDGSSERIGLAESKDLLTWDKCAASPFNEPSETWYQQEAKDGINPLWGDPFVIFDRNERKYRMFISARRRSGGKPERRGCIATAVSSDMINWSVAPPVCAPGLYPQMSAPFVLEGDGEYHLLYHVIDDDGAVRIFRAVAESPAGPFDIAESPDFFYGKNVCVRPAVFDGEDALFFLHRIDSQPDQSKPLLLPTALGFEEGRPCALLHPRMEGRRGDAMFSVEADLESSETMVRLLPRRGRDVVFSARLDMSGGGIAGMLFRTSITGKENLTLWLDSGRSDITLMRGVKGERIISAPFEYRQKDSVKVVIFAEGPLVMVYIDRRLAMSAPVVCRPAGGVGLAVDQGKVRFREVILAPLLPTG